MSIFHLYTHMKELVKKYNTWLSVLCSIDENNKLVPMSETCLTFSGVRGNVAAEDSIILHMNRSIVFDERSCVRIPLIILNKFVSTNERGSAAYKASVSLNMEDGVLISSAKGTELQKQLPEELNEYFRHGDIIPRATILYTRVPEDDEEDS